MGIFNRKKNEEKNTEAERLNENLRDDISKAYDELISGEVNETAEETEPEQKNISASDFETEVFKAKMRAFKEKKTQEALVDVIELLPGRKFFLPSVSNMKEPFEKNGNRMKLKHGAVLNPALLSSNNTTYLPIFTDEQAMTQKSPSGVVLKFNFEQCVGIVYNKKNPVKAIVINPFTENVIIGEELLNAAFKKIEKTNDSEK